MNRMMVERSGFTLIELLLFLVILGIMGVVLLGVFIDTQEARLDQQAKGALEQRGAQVMEVLTRRIRRAETVLYPPVTKTGSILALQMSVNAEQPTIFSQTAQQNLYVVEKDIASTILNDRIKLTNLVFRNAGNSHVDLDLDLSIDILSPSGRVYTKHFESAVTLFPDDQWSAGGCTLPYCPVPTCSGGHKFSWYYCDNSTATPTCQLIDPSKQLDC